MPKIKMFENCCSSLFVFLSHLQISHRKFRFPTGNTKKNEVNHFEDGLSTLVLFSFSKHCNVGFSCEALTHVRVRLLGPCFKQWGFFNGRHYSFQDLPPLQIWCLPDPHFPRSYHAVWECKGSKSLLVNLFYFILFY